MPKIPIDFTLGNYEDDNPRLGNRQLFNCYPETTLGAVNKTVCRSVEGYDLVKHPSITDVNTGIYVNDDLYAVIGGDLYKFAASTSYNTGVFIGAMGGFHDTTPTIMATNGQNIVIISPGSSSTGSDYYYDFVTFDKIQNKDADYSGFGKARDVVVKDGYYVFITNSSIFHGSNASTTDGLSFNPLSFAALPEAYVSGQPPRALAVANSQIYAFTGRQTFLYQTAPTTPFSFALSTGFDLDVGIASYTAKVVYDDTIALVSRTGSNEVRLMLITGTSYQYIGTDDVDSYCVDLAANDAIQMSTYTMRGHRMVQIIENATTSGFSTGIAYVYDATESAVKGYSTWHKRGIYDGSGFGQHRIRQYLDSSNNIVFGDHTTAIGTINANGGFAFYSANKSQSLGNDSVFDSASSVTENAFQVSFPFIRVEGDPVLLRSVRLRFTDNVSEVELFVSTNGVTFTSLGEIDLTSIDSKTAEWRRLGRYNEDATFKVVYKTELVTPATASDGNKVASLIEGYLVV